MLLGGGYDGNDGWSGVQRLRPNDHLPRLPSQRQRRSTASTATRLSGGDRLQHEPCQEVGHTNGRLVETEAKEEALSYRFRLS